MKTIFFLLFTIFMIASCLAQNPTIVDSNYRAQSLKRSNRKILIGSSAFVVGTAIAAIGILQIGDKKNYSGVQSSVKNSFGNAFLIGLGGALEVTGIILGVDGIVKHRQVKNLKVGSELIYLPGIQKNMAVMKLVILL